MRTQDFSYHLPKSSIAQTPVTPRDRSKLMVINRDTDTLAHHIFADLTDILGPNDVLVCNQSAVFPARLFVTTETRVAPIEVFLLKNTTDNQWQALARPRKKLTLNTPLNIINTTKQASDYTLNVVAKHEDGTITVDFGKQSIHSIWSSCGHTPLPPYITEREQDTSSKYQTVYANQTGSVAAPTAGLHFTERLIAELLQTGVSIEYVTLHVGLGTFLPVKTDSLEEHKMHSESYMLDEQTAERLNTYKQQGKRIIAVGTTSVRVLESAANSQGQLTAQDTETEIFIYPGYQWKFVDGLITNFHLPESTLLMLVSALWEKDKVLDAYTLAVQENYRFYSFGDAMLIV
jgi:S-adenosylmethionine:tRNA ribosyltransferase-isomerase